MTGIVHRRSSSKFDVFDLKKQILVKNCTVKGKKLSQTRGDNQIVVGDRVEYTADAQIVRRYKRDNAFVRWLPRLAKVQILCANIDRLAVASAFENHLLDVEFITRCIVVAEAMDIPTVLICNKSDRCDAPLISALQDLVSEAGERYRHCIRSEADEHSPESLLSFLDESVQKFNQHSVSIEPALQYFGILAALGYRLYCCSAARQHNIAALKDEFRDSVSAIIGLSGVGKSTLLNVLDPSAEAKTMEDRKFRGRHTTSVATWYHSEAYDLVDTPGIEHVHLYALPFEAIAQGFQEFRILSEACKFRGCVHLAEPDCAVREASTKNAFLQRRYRIYQSMLAEWRDCNARYAWHNKDKHYTLKDTGVGDA